MKGFLKELRENPLAASVLICAVIIVVGAIKIMVIFNAD